MRGTSCFKLFDWTANVVIVISDRSLRYENNFRSIRPKAFYKKGVLRNFAKFTGKHLCQSLFFNKVADLEACDFIKKETLAQFSCEFYEILKNTIFYKTARMAASAVTKNSV